MTSHHKPLEVFEAEAEAFFAAGAVEDGVFVLDDAGTGITDFGGRSEAEDSEGPEFHGALVKPYS